MRIGIIGHFGGKEKFNDGQTVKTIAIYDALKRYGIEDVGKYTQDGGVVAKYYGVLTVYQNEDKGGWQ